MSADKTTKRTVLGGRSRLRDAALAVLTNRSAHGYGVVGDINRRVGPSWHIEARHIYPTLKQLERDGLLRSERKQHGAKLRRVFHATEKAQEARRQWLAARPARSVVQSDMQTRLAFSKEDDVPELLRAFGERRMDILEEIGENAADEPLRGSYLGIAMALYRSAVDKVLKAELEWIEEAIRELQALLEMWSRR